MLTLLCFHHKLRKHVNMEVPQSYPKQLTILPVEVLSGHADVYSKLVPGSSTGCCPVTPKPLHGEQLFLSEINSNHKPTP
jgi:hypothetical protein